MLNAGNFGSSFLKDNRLGLRVYNAIEFGDVGETNSVQLAMDQAWRDGGGTVWVPPSDTSPPVSGMFNGVWRSGAGRSLIPRSGITLAGVRARTVSPSNCPGNPLVAVAGTIFSGVDWSYPIISHATEPSQDITFDATNNEVVCTTAHGLENGERVVFVLGYDGVAPTVASGGLDGKLITYNEPTYGTPTWAYYVKNKSTLRFQLSTLADLSDTVDFTGAETGSIEYNSLDAVQHFYLENIAFTRCLNAIKSGARGRWSFGHGWLQQFKVLPLATSEVSSEDWAVQVVNDQQLNMAGFTFSAATRGLHRKNASLTCAGSNSTTRDYDIWLEQLDATTDYENRRGVLIECEFLGKYPISQGALTSGGVYQNDLHTHTNGLILAYHNNNAPLDTIHFEIRGGGQGAIVSNVNVLGAAFDGDGTYNVLMRDCINCHINLTNAPASYRRKATVRAINATQCSLHSTSQTCALELDYASFPFAVSGNIEQIQSYRTPHGVVYQLKDGMLNAPTPDTTNPGGLRADGSTAAVQFEGLVAGDVVVGDTVEISGVKAAVGGISAANLNGDRTVTAVSGSTITFTAGASSSSGPIRGGGLALPSGPLQTFIGERRVRVTATAHGFVQGTDNNKLISFAGLTGGVSGIPLPELNNTNMTVAIGGLATFVRTKRLRVTFVGHGCWVGQRIKLSALGADIGGIAVADINRDDHVVREVIDADNFEIMLYASAINATSSAVSVGTATLRRVQGMRLARVVDANTFEVWVNTPATASATGLGGAAGYLTAVNLRRKTADARVRAHTSQYGPEHTTPLMSGTATLAAGTVAIAFPRALEDAKYKISLAGNAAEIFSWASKATTGFTINSNNGSSTATVDWSIER